MTKNFLKRYLPSEQTVRNNRLLQLLGPVLFNPMLWHLHRRNVAKGVAIGLFSAFIPLPIQMFLSAVISLVMRANLPVALLCCLVSNPLTMAPMIIISYKVGTWALGKPEQLGKFVASFDWLIGAMGRIWEPLLLGSVLCGLLAGFIGYVVMRLIWRFWVIQHWKRRAASRSL